MQIVQKVIIISVKIIITRSSAIADKPRDAGL